MAPAELPLLGPVVTVLVNDAWKPIKKHVGYCLKPATHMHCLAKAADDLENERANIEERIEVGKREGKTPKKTVKSWIKRAESVCDESYGMKNEYDTRTKHACGYSWNCLFNYRISKSAAKKKKAVDDMKQRTPKNDSIFSLLPPVGRELPLPSNIVEQKEHMDKILGYMKQSTWSIIGIYGVAMSGKTTLLKQLNNFFISKDVQEFDHVIYVQVGRRRNLKKIQDTIASHLGLLLAQNEDTLARSTHMYSFLKERRFVLLIDDLRQAVDLEKVGIPQGHKQSDPLKRQVIVITTRQQKVCRKMKIHDDQMILLEAPWSEEPPSPSDANGAHDSLALCSPDGNGVQSPAQATSTDILAWLHLSPLRGQLTGVGGPTVLRRSGAGSGGICPPVLDLAHGHHGRHGLAHSLQLFNRGCLPAKLKVIIMPIIIQLQPSHAAAIFHGGVNPIKLSLGNDRILEFQPSSLQKTRASLPCYNLIAAGGMISGETTASPIVFDVLPAPDGRTIQLRPASYCNYSPLSLTLPGGAAGFLLPQLAQMLAGTQFTFLPPWATCTSTATATAPQSDYAFAPALRTGSSTVVLEEIVEDESPAPQATRTLQLFPPSPDLNDTAGPAQVVLDLNGPPDTVEGPTLPELNLLPAVPCR